MHQHGALSPEPAGEHPCHEHCHGVPSSQERMGGCNATYESQCSIQSFIAGDGQNSHAGMCPRSQLLPPAVTPLGMLGNDGVWKVHVT